jgi:hypothetical protein
MLYFFVVCKMYVKITMLFINFRRLIHDDFCKNKEVQCCDEHALYSAKITSILCNWFVNWHFIMESLTFPITKLPSYIQLITPWIITLRFFMNSVLLPSSCSYKILPICTNMGQLSQNKCLWIFLTMWKLSDMNGLAAKLSRKFWELGSSPRH